jgi:PBP1b-binding outer membrane lipoprotein LpoB
VNVGKVRVVDRQNIARIVKEYEFQQSQLTDETTAVRIGKLSGADIIVIGSISYVGERYYLNIKLISVETGEIIGSSIAGSAQASEFYDMCNEAVYRLF